MNEEELKGMMGEYVEILDKIHDLEKQKSALKDKITTFVKLNEVTEYVDDNHNVLTYKRTSSRRIQKALVEDYCEKNEVDIGIFYAETESDSLRITPPRVAAKIEEATKD